MPWSSSGTGKGSLVVPLSRFCRQGAVSPPVVTLLLSRYATSPEASSVRVLDVAPVLSPLPPMPVVG